MAKVLRAWTFAILSGLTVTVVSIMDTLSSLPFWLRQYRDGNPLINTVLHFPGVLAGLTIIFFDLSPLLFSILILKIVDRFQVSYHAVPILFSIVMFGTAGFRSLIVYRNLMIDSRMGWL